MTVLTAQQRLNVTARFNSRVGNERLEFGALTKSDVAAAISALDDFFDANLGAINNAFPQPARAQLTVRQKALIVIEVIKERYGV